MYTDFPPVLQKYYRQKSNPISKEEKELLAVLRLLLTK